MTFVSPPHPQTDADREYLTSLIPLFRNFPENFEFPLATDPDYEVPVNTLYCFVTGMIICGFTTIIVLLRFWVRAKVMESFGTDDWVMVPTFLCYCVFNVVNIWGVFGTGFGYHVYDNSKRDISTFLAAEYLHVIFSFATLHLCRISIQHLLLRLTLKSSTFQRRYLFALLAVSYLFFLATIFVQIFQCGVPASKAFDLKANFDGTCITLKSLTVYGVMMSGHIILDGFTIFPPLLVLFRLPMSTVKKFNLGFLLILSCITMVCSGVRPFIFFKIMVNSYDISWNGTAVAFWGIMETSIALIIASLPALNRSIVKFIGLDHLLSDSSGQESLSDRLRLNRNVYRGPSKFVRYTADATSYDATRNYLELGSLGGSKSDERLQRPSSDKKYPRIRVERSYHLTEERASVLELEREEDEEATMAKDTITRPVRVKVSERIKAPSSRDEDELLTERV
ncbi:hypothetical protein TWF696_007228 [Orbilia brochopaga]|uniref:Rhodopsin domain-containing protein n=1 Tax=Orbilia brochopaga TaxID=3140254 RepID=A0AAV9US11_9PEZI